MPWAFSTENSGHFHQEQLFIVPTLAQREISHSNFRSEALRNSVGSTVWRPVWIYPLRQNDNRANRGEIRTMISEQKKNPSSSTFLMNCYQRFNKFVDLTFRRTPVNTSKPRTPCLYLWKPPPHPPPLWGGNTSGIWWCSFTWIMRVEYSCAAAVLMLKMHVLVIKLRKIVSVASL